MSELLPKNLWINLTVIVPGAVTYGSWRLLLLAGDGWNIDLELLAKVDESVFLSLCFVAAISIAQQAASIVLEALLGGICAIIIGRKRGWGKLFLGRFRMIAQGKLNEDSLRTLGQFFMSVNVLIGQIYLLLYFLLFERIQATSGLAVLLYCVVAIVFLSCVFRAWNAKEALS